MVITLYKVLDIGMKRLLFLLAVMCVAVAALAGTGLVREDGRSRDVLLYDNYFNSCTCALVAGVDSAGINCYALALTLEEGNINIKQGMDLDIRLRSGAVVKLHCAGDVNRTDVRYRRFKNDKIRYTTIYYHISDQQLALLVEEESTRISIFTTSGIIERQLKKVKNKFAQILNELKYR